MGSAKIVFKEVTLVIDAATLEPVVLETAIVLRPTILASHRWPLT